jgi:hypothetical protein
VSFPLESIIQDGIDEQFHSNDCRLELIIGASGVWVLCVEMLISEGRDAIAQGFVSSSINLSS